MKKVNLNSKFTLIKFHFRKRIFIEGKIKQTWDQIKRKNNREIFLQNIMKNKNITTKKFLFILIL